MKRIYINSGFVRFLAQLYYCRKLRLLKIVLKINEWWIAKISTYLSTFTISILVDPCCNMLCFTCVVMF